MTDLHFQSEEHLNSFIKNLQFIGLGSESYCYKLDKNTTFKYLCGPAYIERSKEEILQFKDINIPNYIFAENLVYIKEEIVGVLMKYISGENLEFHKLDQIKVLNLIKALDDLMLATKQLSNLNIIAFDVCPVNILYSKGRFYLIDTMDYLKVEDSSEKIFQDNMAHITFNIYQSIITAPILKFITSIPEIKDFKKDVELLTNPSYILKVLLEELNNYFGCEIKTIKEASKKLIKN